MSDTFSATTPIAAGLLNAGDYAWSNVANWSTGAISNQNTAASITTTGYTLLVDGADIANTITFGAVATGALSLMLAAGTSLTAVNGAIIAGGDTVSVLNTSTGAFKISGGTLEIKNNGVFNMLGGTFTANSGGVTLDNGATANFGAGVTFNVNTLTLTGTSALTLDVGSLAAPNVISSVNDSANSSVLTESGGDLQIGVAGGGTFMVSNGGVIEFVTGVNAGAAINLAGGLVDVDQNVSLQSGTKFAFSGTTASTLFVASSNNFQNGFGYSVTGFTFGDKLQFGSLNLTGDTYTYTGTTLTVKNGGTTVLTLSNLSLASGVTNPTFLLTGNTVSLACFLAGTLIETASGARPVEELRAGDRVVVLEQGRPVLRPARWIGSRRIQAAQHAGDPDAYPVRIRADAFAPGLPRRDLLVTGEHGIHVEGGLIPARMLINGRSIVRDTRITHYTVYHVEFETHAIMLAEGLETESYLDTGNRGSFGLPGQGRGALDWAADAAAPLTVTRAAVEPVWRALDGRADALGLPRAPALMLSSDPELALLLADGRRVLPRWQAGGRYFFQLPDGARAAHLLSRAARPSESVGAFVDDRRLLGVAVSQIALWEGLSERVLRADELGGSGWHGLESDPAAGRWTDGRATLSLPVATGAESFLEVRVASLMAYPDPQPDTDRLAA